MRFNVFRSILNNAPQVSLQYTCIAGSFFSGLSAGTFLSHALANTVVRGAVKMPERANRIPPSKSWADEIDDLYHDATERSLKAIIGTRARGLVREVEGADDRSPATVSHDAQDLQRPVSLHR
jgi:hypothetical protein